MSRQADVADLACSCVVLALPLVLGMVAWSTRCRRDEPLSDRVRATALPAHFCRVGLWALAPLVRAILKLGVAPNTITALSLVAGVAAGVSLVWGHFGFAGLLFVVASCGDALDGLVARASRRESPGGALFDASVDRYEEFFAFGGLAMFFRSSGPLLTLTLVALAGSFMVSYGSAQAEARHLAVPPGLMRRPERAVCLGLGIVLGPIASAFASGHDGALSWARELPVIVALAVIGVVANVCAVRRIRTLAATIRVTHPSRASGVARVARETREPGRGRIVVSAG
jgi:CDP-diacylglycerol---glycerol-3-phosphate 3-phosphatidyltransferase